MKRSPIRPKRKTPRLSESRMMGPAQRLTARSRQDLSGRTHMPDRTPRRSTPLAGEPGRWIIRMLSEASHECLDWPYAVSGKGYGSVWWNGRTRKVSHIVLELSGSERPSAPANHALHSCDRPICCNPHHLRWGSNLENAQEAFVRGLTLLPKSRGEDNGRAVLTETQVRQIRMEYARGEGSLAELGLRYGVSKRSIHRIVLRKSWEHVQ